MDTDEMDNTDEPYPFILKIMSASRTDICKSASCKILPSLSACLLHPLETKNHGGREGWKEGDPFSIYGIFLFQQKYCWAGRTHRLQCHTAHWMDTVGRSQVNHQQGWNRCPCHRFSSLDGHRWSISSESPARMESMPVSPASLLCQGSLRLGNDRRCRGQGIDFTWCHNTCRANRFVAVMPGQYSLDKQMLLRYMGAELFLTDPALGFPGMQAKIEELKKELPNVHVLDQFTNQANPEAHMRWTGTGGTVCGVGKYRKMKKPDVKIICVQPAESPVISGGAPGKHKIEGVGPGFLPVINEVVTVTTEEAMMNARRLANEEGLLVGISSGANLAACLKVVSREENKGKMIVIIFPSRGERYMNSDLFATVRSAFP